MYHTHCTWFRAPENRSEVPHKPQRPRWHHASTLHLPCARRLPGRNATNISHAMECLLIAAQLWILRLVELILGNRRMVHFFFGIISCNFISWRIHSSWFCRSDHQRTARSILMSRQVPGWTCSSHHWLRENLQEICRKSMEIPGWACKSGILPNGQFGKPVS